MSFLTKLTGIATPLILPGATRLPDHLSPIFPSRLWTPLQSDIDGSFYTTCATPQTVSATSEATAQDLAWLNRFKFPDQLSNNVGQWRVVFYLGGFLIPGAVRAQLTLVLWDEDIGGSLGQLASMDLEGGSAIIKTGPIAASVPTFINFAKQTKTLSIRAFRGGSNVSIQGGGPGAGSLFPPSFAIETITAVG